MGLLENTLFFSLSSWSFNNDLNLLLAGKVIHLVHRLVVEALFDCHFDQLAKLLLHILVSLTVNDGKDHVLCLIHDHLVLLARSLQESHLFILTIKDEDLDVPDDVLELLREAWNQVILLSSREELQHFLA